MDKQIETDRLILRDIEEKDIKGIFELDSDPEVHRYLGNKPIKTWSEAESIVNYIRDQYETDGIGRWAVIDKASQEFVGWAGLKYERAVRTDMDYYDLGYRLKRKFWGRGIATEASLASLEYGFEVLNLQEIYAGAHIKNTGSNKVLRKVGLRFLETFEYDGEPHHWYRMGRDEWKGVNK
ncbi:MAG: GNAT family N-acetyltransferase [Bacteroidota bacterium]